MRATQRVLLGMTAASCMALTACGGDSSETSAGADDFDPATAVGPDRAQKIQECAEEEGSVTLYTQLIVDQAVEPLIAAFESEYPGVSVNYVRNDGASLVQRLTNEQRAGQVQADVYEGALAGGAAVRAEVAQEFTTPATDGFPEQYLDPDNMYVPTVHYYGILAYNSDRLSESELPSSYDDLLEPQFANGAVAFGSDPGNSGPFLISAMREAWGEEKTRDWLSRFAQQQPVDAGNTARALADQVISGEYGAGLPILAHHVSISAGEGAPVGAVTNLDPVPSQVSSAILIKDAPNPCAGMLLIDFLLGEKGTDTLIDAGYIPVNPDAELPEETKAVVPSADVEQFLTPAQLDEMRSESVEMFTEYFQ